MVTVHFLWTFWTFLAVPCRHYLNFLGEILEQLSCIVLFTKAKDTKDA